MKNWPLPRPVLSVRNIALLFGWMLVFWAPLWGNQRLPLALLVVLGVYLHIRSGKALLARRAERRMTALLLLVGLPCLLSTFTSLSPASSITLCAVLLLHFWAGIALLRGLRDGGHARLAIGVGIVLVFWFVDGLVQLLAGQDLFGAAMLQNRVTGPFDGNLHLSLFLVVLMPLLLWPLADRHPWAAIALFAALTSLSVLGGARTNLVFALLVMGLLWLRLAHWRHRLALLATCLLPVLALPLSPQLMYKLGDQDYARLGQAVSDGDAGTVFAELDAISSHRLVIWDTAVNMLKDRPLLGVGPHAFDKVYRQYATRPGDPFRSGDTRAFHAHQMYIGVAAETGLVGLAGLIAAIGLCLVWYFRADGTARARAAPYAASLAVIAFPINSQPVLFAGWWFPIVLMLVCGLLAALDDATTPAAGEVCENPPP